MKSAGEVLGMSGINQNLEKLIQEAPEESQITQDQESKSSHSKSYISNKLKEFKFPHRHIDRLAEMYGPSLEKAQSLWPRIESGDCLLILCGDRGPGKTQMATWWAAERAKDDKYSIYFKAHDLLSLIRQQFSDDRQGQHEATQALTHARKRRFLVIDEFSELAGSEWEKRTLTNILDHRYDSMLATVIITNHKPEDAADAVGRSVWSRAEETGGIVECQWNSYRKQG